VRVVGELVDRVDHRERDVLVPEQRGPLRIRAQRQLTPDLAPDELHVLLPRGERREPRVLHHVVAADEVEEAAPLGVW
jgi:hypothetical protein